MTTRREQYRAWGECLHAELEAYYDCGLGDLEAHVDLGDLFEVYADAETALAMAGFCYCDKQHDGPCLTCINEAQS